MATPSNKQEALWEVLDALYMEIREIEAEHGMATGGSDLRVPVESYHDAVRSVMQGLAEPERLSVDWLSHDMKSMRQRIGWLRSGPHIFWQHQNPRYDMQLKEARELKQFAIRNSRHIEIPFEVTQKDLLAFGRRVRPENDGYNRFERLAHELKYREAQKYVTQVSRTGNSVHGRWTKIEPKEFWDAFAYTVGFFSEMQHEFHLENQRLQLEHKSGRKGMLTRRSGRAMLETGQQAMKDLWIQIMHPMSLRAALKQPVSRLTGRQKPSSKYPVFDAERYQSEEDWQAFGRDARNLADLYDRYSVMFAAFTQEVMDQSYTQERDFIDRLVRDSYRLLKTVEQMEAGEEVLEIHQIERLLHEITNEELKRRLEAILAKRRISTSSSGGFREDVESVMHQAEREGEILEQAHFNYLSSQLSAYEGAKDVVKQLAGKGLNLAGKFVENAAAVAAQRGKGGGRGM